MNRSILCGALLSAVVPFCLAQSPAMSPINPGDPLDARAHVPALAASTSLGSYRAHRPTEVAPWRQSNDAVFQAGGWKAYARQGQTRPAGSGQGVGADHGHARPHGHAHDPQP